MCERDLTSEQVRLDEMRSPSGPVWGSGNSGPGLSRCQQALHGCLRRPTSQQHGISHRHDSWMNANQRSRRTNQPPSKETLLSRVTQANALHAPACLNLSLTCLFPTKKKSKKKKKNQIEHIILIFQVIVCAQTPQRAKTAIPISIVSFQKHLTPLPQPPGLPWSAGCPLAIILCAVRCSDWCRRCGCQPGMCLAAVGQLHLR